MASTDEYTNLDYWKNKWDKGMTGWHIDFVDKHLEKYIDLLTNGDTGLNIFVPLCGRSMDLKWLVDKGHKVFGVEISDEAVTGLFTDVSLSPKVTPIGSNSTLYEACDGKFKVLAGDMLSLESILGQFDCIWDKNSFGAINPVDRDRYADLIHSILKPQGRILMCAFVYDQSERSIPPFSVSTDTLKSHYGNRFDIEFLESVEFEEKRKTFKLTSLDRLLHLMKKL